MARRNAVRRNRSIHEPDGEDVIEAQQRCAAGTNVRKQPSREAQEERSTHVKRVLPRMEERKNHQTEQANRTGDSYRIRGGVYAKANAQNAARQTFAIQPERNIRVEVGEALKKSVEAS